MGKSCTASYILFTAGRDGGGQGQQRAQSDIALGLINTAQGGEKDPSNCYLDPFEVWTLSSLPLDEDTELLFSLSFHGASRKP